MLICKPEGWGGADLPTGLAGWQEAISDSRVMEANVLYCDAAHNLHVNLNGIGGIIPRAEAALGIGSGKTKEIAILSRVGKPVSFCATGISPGEKPRILLSRSKAQERAYELYRQFAVPGTVVDARVTHLESFGVFVDIGWGFVSFIGIENISVSRIAHPSERLSVGWDIKAVVTGMEDGRVLLSHKELLGTWEENAAGFAPGETVTGVVRGVEDYGVFIELMPNLSGLCGQSDDLKEGERVIVYIKSIQPDRMKIKLSLVDKLPCDNPPARPRYFLPADNYMSRWAYSPGSSKTKQLETLF